MCNEQLETHKDTIMQGHDTDRTKFDSRDYQVVCHQCGQTFEAKRSDATFCSPKCRVRFSREPQKLINAVEHINSMKFYTSDYAGRYSHNALVEEALLSLQRAIANALAEMDVNRE